MNTHRPDDDSLPGEDELGALYRKLPRKEPGPALDAAVLRAAAQAVRGAEPAAATLRSARRRRWPIALGSAAVLVLAAGLGWRMRDMPANTLPVQPSAVTVQEAARPAAPAVEAAPAAANDAESRASDATVSPSAQIAPARIAEAKVRQADALVAKRAAPQASILQEQAASAPAPMAAAPAAPATELRAYAPKRAEAAAQGYAADRKATEVAPNMMATPAMAPPAPPPAIDTARNAQDTPAQELDKIRQLLAAQHRDEARQRLADFHRDHPDYPLPDDLRQQLLTP